MVTRDPGPWFDETLAALGAQNYDELSVLVVVSGGESDPTERVAAHLPGAFVSHLSEDHGFGAAVNGALPLVEGAAFFLLCHDDCAPDADAVRLMVEESFRSNAGMVTPKVVRWDDPSVLVHVGMSADRTGAVVDRVQEGEIDHGQHDAVRDVFVAPGGCTLVRADLLRELGGYDTAMVAMGEDLDLSWRAQAAGARVVVAPQARVRHLELTAAGQRALSPAAGEATTLQGLQRRNELRAMLKCSGTFNFLGRIVLALLLSAGEIVLALAVRDRERTRAVVGAWRDNLAHRRELRQLRRQVRAQRVNSDRQLRALMVPGLTRLSTYLTRLVHQGFDTAHGLVPSRSDAPTAGVESAVLTGSVGLAFSEDADFDDLDDLGRRSGRDRFGRHRRRPLMSSHRSRLAVYLATALVLVVGTRGLLGQAFPQVGQLAPLGSWSSAWHQFFAGWHTPGVGTTAPATPAFALLGVSGTALFGAMGLLQKVLVLGCIPLGAWGVLRFLRPLASGRARLAAGLAYLGLPLCYNALGQGRWDGLVAFAALPFLLKRLAVAGGFPPFAEGRPRAPWWRHALVLGVIEAVAVSFAPAVAPAVLVCAVGIVIGSALVGEWKGAGRTVGVGLAGTVVAAVLCGPWLVGTLAAGPRSALGVFGLAPGAGVAPGWSSLVTFMVGQVGHSPLTWLLVVAGLLPLLIGRGPRLAWAARLWAVSCSTWVLALAVSRGMLGAFSPQLTVLLAPAAVGVAACVGLGVAAFDTDLSGFTFGWRQAVSAAAVVAATLGLVPVVVSASGGRWGLPTDGYEQALGFLSRPSSTGAGRVLWLGDPAVLPTGGWSVRPGFAYATSEQGLPQPEDVWSPAGPGPTRSLADAVQLAMAGGTRHLGLLLAPGAVRYIVVVSSLAPSTGPAPRAGRAPPPTGLVAGLLQQEDLLLEPGGGGYVVFENTDFLAERAVRGGGPVTAAGFPPVPPAPGDLTGWQPLFGGAAGSTHYAGAVTAGTVYSGTAPAGDWRLTGPAGPVPSHPAFGWAGQYAVPVAGQAALSFSGSPWVPLSSVAEVLLWLALLALAALRWLRAVRRRARTGLASSVPAPVAAGGAGTEEAPHEAATLEPRVAAVGVAAGGALARASVVAPASTPPLTATRPPASPAPADGAGSNGAGSDAAASDGAGSDGAASDGAASDGAGSDGAASDGANGGSDAGPAAGPDRLSAEHLSTEEDA